MNKSILFIALPSLTIACAEPTQSTLGEDDEDVVDTDGDTDDSGSESGDPDEPDDPEPACDLSTHTCVSNVPDGWTGPVTRLDADGRFCHGEFERSSIQVYDAFTVNPSACGCECGSPHDGTCVGQTGVQIYPPWTGDGIPHNMNTCDTLEDELVVLAGTPAPFPEAWFWNDTWLIAEQPAVELQGICDVTGATVDLPEPERSGVMWGCLVSDEPTACDDDTICVPQSELPYDGELCIWRNGDEACPADTDFVHRKVVSSGIADTRGCTECTCDAAAGELCDAAEVVLTRDASAPVPVDADGTCRFAGVQDDGWNEIEYEPGVPSGGACNPGGGELFGSIEPRDTITFCCA